MTLFTLALAAQAQSPYISKVFEYLPAPGQFVNEMPEWEEGDDAEAMRQKAEDCIANHQQTVITLGSWGGYVVFGFDHMVKNKRGKYDFKLLGNSFYALSNPKDTTAIGGSAEPGVVMVSYDANGNGVPDDTWYELAGSEHHSESTTHRYSCTYYRPAANHVPTPGPSAYLTDTTYIRWKASDGRTGHVYKLSFHKQNYFPNWIATDSLTFSGTRLRDNAIETNGEYILYCFNWGYADDQPNTATFDTDDDTVPIHLRHVSEFKIDWAVDANGHAVTLPGIHFVKVYTGVQQFNGWLGEASTEIMDAWDLHLLDANGHAVTEDEDDEDIPYDIDGNGIFSVSDITTLIEVYLKGR